MLISVILAVGETQADGRRFVKELHTHADGRTFPYEYLADPELDLQAVLEERAALIGSRLAAREAARLAVVGTEVPWTKHDFLNLFSSVERQSIRRRALTDENVQDFMEMLAASGGVYKSKAWPGLSYLAHIGEITWERAEAIAEAMNG